MLILQVRTTSTVHSLSLGVQIRKLLLNMEREHWVFSLKKAKFFHLRSVSGFMSILKVKLKQVISQPLNLITLLFHKSCMFGINQIFLKNKQRCNLRSLLLPFMFLNSVIAYYWPWISVAPRVPEHFLSTEAELLEFHWRIKLTLPFIKANSPTQSQTIVQNIRCEHVQQGSELGKAR